MLKPVKPALTACRCCAPGNNSYLHAQPADIQLTRCCRLVEDTAWHPVAREDMEKWTPLQVSVWHAAVPAGSDCAIAHSRCACHHRRLFGPQAFLYKTFLGSPLKLFASVGHWCAKRVLYAARGHTGRKHCVRAFPLPLLAFKHLSPPCLNCAGWFGTLT